MSFRRPAEKAQNDTSPAPPTILSAAKIQSAIKAFDTDAPREQQQKGIKDLSHIAIMVVLAWVFWRSLRRLG